MSLWTAQLWEFGWWLQQFLPDHRGECPIPLAEPTRSPFWLRSWFWFHVHQGYFWLLFDFLFWTFSCSYPRKQPSHAKAINQQTLGLYLSLCSFDYGESAVGDKPWQADRPDSEPLRPKDMSQLSGDLLERYAFRFLLEMFQMQHIFPISKDFVSLIVWIWRRKFLNISFVILSKSNFSFSFLFFFNVSISWFCFTHTWCLKTREIQHYL